MADKPQILLHRISKVEEEIFTAYRKFKSLIYNENYSLPIRLQLAGYESADIDNKLNALAKQILLRDDKYFEQLIGEIKFIAYPKQLQGETPANFKGVFFTNQRSSGSYECSRLTCFIDCPIEIHLLSVLWVMRIGHVLDGELSDACYANRLHRNMDNDIYNKGIKLFKKYHERYTDWRNNTIQKAKRMHTEGMDTAILNLDIKDFYHSVDFDLNEEIQVKKRSDKWLNHQLSKIHAAYLKVLIDANVLGNDRKILPIGLVSSSILANYYFKDFDTQVEELVNPLFYGRYVDDIMLVFKSPANITKEADPVASFIDRCIAKPLERSDVLQLRREEKTANEGEQNTSIDYDFKIDYKGNTLIFQQSKVKLFNFLKDEPISLLEEFEENIRKNSSEFRLLPEEDSLIDSFDKASSHISYSDSINKVRSIEGFRYDKLQASRHLSLLISASKNTQALEGGKIEQVCKNLEDFFKGLNSIELNGMWEKIFAFYIINKRYDKVIAFTKYLLDEIVKVKYSTSRLNYANNDDDITEWLRVDLIQQLFNSLSMAATLNLSAFESKVIEHLHKDFKEHTGFAAGTLKDHLEAIKQNAEQLIHSNLLRHNYISFPLLNYCVFNRPKVDKVDRLNYIDNNSIKGKTLKLATEDNLKIRYSPRFIHFHEVCLFYALAKHYGTAEDKSGAALNVEYLLLNHTTQDELEGFPDSPANAPELPADPDVIQNEFNEDHYSLIIDKFLAEYPTYFSNDPKHSKDDNKLNNADFKLIKLGNRPGKKKVKVAMANMKVDAKNSIRSFLGTPNLSFDRYLDLCHMLNEAARTKCDIVVFPEISIPFAWLGNITDYVRRNNIALICGVEHVADLDGVVYNYVVTILPFKHKVYRNAFVDLRLKRDYSHSEEKLINGHVGFSVPPSIDRNKHKLRVYDWNGLMFSVFNCFEFADITKRATLKGNVDFVIAVEHNRDTNYFSNILESSSRDIHAYVIQVNDSSWGDSRISQPSATATKDLVRIKGGEHVQIVTGEIDIEGLREFQMKNFSLQEDSKTFKSTPPGFKVHDNRKLW
ncbi:hypothetical protein H9Q13_16645 [Pontibacter sp. JH31]|uniref:CN hydrolase domain-containing protein n=1 Tax=Pontibacter aquaedesilientis TaxID=2766980 RepID=A0ABR7XMB6_9BACT|nr:reverse transcriptase domain-containing protein [Pontibacter aquaedesilientis]MBD1398803.1 hypothetical protein [Pontibacter aquaedesilientis]